MTTPDRQISQVGICPECGTPIYVCHALHEFPNVYTGTVIECADCYTSIQWAGPARGFEKVGRDVIPFPTPIPT